MTQIVRKFDSSNSAKTAADELRQRGFGAVEIIEIPAERRGNGGGAVLRVEAPFGTATSATTILDRHGGRDAGREPVGSDGSHAAAPSPAAPQRSANVAPPAAPTASPRSADQGSLDQGSQQRTKSGSRTLSEWLGIPELISSDTFFSVFPLLIRPTPITGATLTDDQPARHASARGYDRHHPARHDQARHGASRPKGEARSGSAFIRSESDTTRAITRPDPITIGPPQQRNPLRQRAR